MFERMDWTLFRELSKLGQKSGVPQHCLPALVLKELVDNALDVAGLDHFRAGLLPGENGFFVEDGGRGFDGDDERVAEMFSIARPLASTKLLRMPTRGALGNGLRVVAGAVLASAGSLRVSTRGRTLRLVPRDEDGRTGVEGVADWDGTGTRVEVRLGPSLAVDPGTLEWATLAATLAGGDSTYQGRTSPHWYDSDSFFELLNAAKRMTAVEVIGRLDGCAHPKAGRLAREFAKRPACDLVRAEADLLLSRARDSARPVRSSRLGSIGPGLPGLPIHHFKAAGEFTLRPARGEHAATLPCVVEAWAEVAEEAKVTVSVNRTPITAEVKAFHDDKDKKIKVFGSGLRHAFPVGRHPVRLHLNVDTPFMPITSDGKAPDLSVFLKIFDGVIGRAAGKAKAHGKVLRIIAGPAKTQKDVILAHLEEAIAKASDGGRYRFSLRQLFYAVRPHVIEALGKEPEYNYFAAVITDHEADRGRDIPGMYRDSRGSIYHPHTGEKIDLGTLSVEAYRRPAWTFNKILYSEKEGFFEVLRDARWPERHDCALLTSKGFASRAARDVLDLLGETGEDIWFYCIHDADAAGTMIYQSLQEGTRARAGRKAHVVNLGLEPAEALEMGLQVEDVVRRGKGGAPVAGYVTPEWAEWLQGKRVELNAMPSPQLLAWLDGKFAGQVGKVVPPEEVLADRLEAEVRARLESRITRKVLRRAKVGDRVERAYLRRQDGVEACLTTIDRQVREDLGESPTRSWTAPVADLAEGISAMPGMTPTARPETYTP